MKKIICVVCCYVGILCFRFVPATDAAGATLLPSPMPHACYPVPAADLLGWLPPAPKNWELLTSTARSVLGYGSTPTTEIVRHYTFVPPPVPPGQPQPEVKLTNIQLLCADTAYNRDSLRVFVALDQKAGTSPGLEVRNLSGFPVVVCKRSTGETIAIFLLGGRMTVTVCGNSDEKDVLDWASQLPLKELQEKILKAPKVAFKETVYMEQYVNQLNPKENRQARIGYKLPTP